MPTSEEREECVGSVGAMHEGCRRRRRPPPSPVGTSSTAEETVSGTEDSCSTALRGDPTMAALLSSLPTSTQGLVQRIDQQREEMRILKEENTRLRAREVEVSALALRLQEHFSSTQSQVDRLKSQIRVELLNPVTEEQYNAIEALEESKRDLIDTVKLGIFQQLGLMKASRDTAVKRATELATEAARLTEENRELNQRLKEMESVVEVERQSFRRQLREAEQRGSMVVELEGKLKDMESRLKNAYVDQEQFLTAKLNASVKTEDAARLAVQLREAEMNAERYKTSAECSEQKLDILKSEYYELKLKNSQRVMELESCLKAAEEKLKTLSDLEMESELFISNLAQQSDGQLAFVSASMAVGGHTGNGADAANPSTSALGNYESWLALPRSRKLAHTLTVTKRCLHLENRLMALQHDLDFKEKQVARLQASLEMAREALNNSNSPFAMVERTVEQLTADNEELSKRVSLLVDENALLRQRLEQRTADVQVLCKHRGELLRIQRILRRLGLDGHVTDATPGGLQSANGCSGSGAAVRSQPDSLNELPRQFTRYQADDSLRTTRETKVSSTESQLRRASLVEEGDVRGVFIPQVIQFTS
ncbi:hypothetical protein TRVL_03331 [Trypanosoma vivax]|uniref:Uncharacterized protein n=1 Tax=Trypanosoma vivax (strain Y486) TaxID=1055687 RepID=F9WMV4_TRYVY|nr:hypothetical protein TRVL_03331 [Trypanosoma vivax]CCD18869.1 hypothetical protein, conserved [Trypanosoma vivax Y486]|eukprot:CCD18869.1 hypothetical protein, conserved [Trypanosoma vivax Y486]